MEETPFLFGRGELCGDLVPAPVVACGRLLRRLVTQKASTPNLSLQTKKKRGVPEVVDFFILQNRGDPFEQLIDGSLTIEIFYEGYYGRS